MRKCGNCYFFKNQFLVGDAEFSCSELGTEFNDSSCGDFRSGRHAEEKNPELIINEARNQLDEKEQIKFDVSQKENLFNILTDIFTIEQDVNIVLDKIKLEIENQGYNLPFNGNKVLNYSSKLTDLFLLHRLTLSTGMGAYLDQIMKLQIEKLFSDPRKYHQKPPDKPFARQQE